MAEPIRKNTTEARGGINIKAIAWVLGISLVLAIIAMVAAYGGSPTPKVEGSATAPGNQPTAAGPATP